MNKEMRQEVLRANLLLNTLGLVIFTWGNVSGIDRNSGEVIIKPSGVPYEKMGLDDLVVVDIEGNRISGEFNPSSDLATHLEIYRTFPACGGVVHTHSRIATAWAQAGADLPAFGTTHADYFYGTIPCTRPLSEKEIQGAYEHETGRVIVETFLKRNIDPMAVPGVLVNGHGPFTWGKTASDSVKNNLVLEQVAQMALGTMQLNPDGKSLPDYIRDKHYKRKHGPDAYYGQE